MGADASKDQANDESGDEGCRLAWTDRPKCPVFHAPAPRETVGLTMTAADGKQMACIVAGRGNALSEFQDVHVLKEDGWTEMKCGGRPPKSRSGHSAVEVSRWGNVGI
eukprot:2404915-Pleurochrysis_carterae.AAC.3